MGRCVSRKTMNRYLDDELPPSAAEGVRAHLDTCESCRREAQRLHALEKAVRCAAGPSAEAPDMAARVTEELRRRGAFFKARVAAARRRVLGDSLLSVRTVAALGVAATLVLMAAAGADHLTRAAWARRTDPILADAERVLVRLVYVRPGGERTLEWAREEAKKLALSQRLAEARSGAGPAWSGDLAPLETTFTMLAQGQALPPDVLARLTDGELLKRTTDLRGRLSSGE